MKPPNQSCRPLFESRNCVFNVGEPKWCCEDSWHKFSLRLSSLPQDWTCQKACKTFQTKGECYVSASRWDERSRWSRFTIRLILLSWALSRWESTAFLFFYYCHDLSILRRTGRMSFLPARRFPPSPRSGCFQLPFNRRKIFTPENEEDNFPSPTLFQETSGLC